MPLVDPYSDAGYNGGAMLLQLMMGWGSATAGSTAARAWNRDDWLRALPLCTWDAAIHQTVPFLRDWVAHPEFDSYWQKSSIRGRTAAITAPMYTIGGWFDIFAKSVFDHVGAVRAGSQSLEAENTNTCLSAPGRMA